MPRKTDVIEYIGKTINYLTVLEEYVDKTKSGTWVRCECTCGKLCVAHLSGMVRGNQKSCGCGGKLHKIGTVLKNTKGLEYVILDYVKVPAKHKCGHVRMGKVKFLISGYEKLCELKEIKSGAIKDLLHKGIANVGYIGVGVYTSKGDNVKCYQTWSDMIKRCYSQKDKETERHYRDVIVCDEWHNYQNFAEWFYNHYTDGFVLDKDLSNLNKRCYSPETCTFVPVEVNSFFTGGLKRGIHWNNSKEKWVAQCQDGELCSTGRKRQTYLGTFDCEQKALSAYKNFKRTKLKSLVSKYKDFITPEMEANMYKIIEDLK